MKVMHYRSLVAVAAFAALAAGCSNDSNPNSPSGFNTVPATAELGAPTPDSPSDGAALDTLRPTLTVNNGTTNAPGNLPRTYEFQLSNSANFEQSSASFISAYAVYKTATVAEGANGKTSYTPDTDLQPGALVYWRARMIQIGQASAWSTTRTVRTKAAAYNRDGELYDPLVDTPSVGELIGPTQYVPGRGLKINDESGTVRYRLVSTIQQGEFSVITENVIDNAGDGKNKILSMQEGTGDITANDYRVTVEHRGNPAGYVAWRFIPGDGNCCEIDTEGAERVYVPLDSNRAYLWTATWDGTFRVRISDLVTGSVRYDLGKPYQRIYRPVEHYAYLGSPVGRGGPVDASKPEVIYRNVWISTKPRPAGLGAGVVVR